jgi:hypothetical protein
MVRAQVFKDKGHSKWSAIFEFNGSKDSTKVGWKFKQQKEAHQFVQEAMEEARTGSVRRVVDKEIQHLD